MPKVLFYKPQSRQMRGPIKRYKASDWINWKSLWYAWIPALEADELYYRNPSNGSFEDYDIILTIMTFDRFKEIPWLRENLRKDIILASEIETYPINRFADSIPSGKIPQGFCMGDPRHIKRAFKDIDLVVLAHRKCTELYNKLLRTNKVKYCPSPNPIGWKEFKDLDQRRLDLVSSTQHVYYSNNRNLALFRELKNLKPSLRTRLHACTERKEEIDECISLIGGHDDKSPGLDIYMTMLNEAYIFVDDAGGTSRAVKQAACLGIPVVGNTDSARTIYPSLTVEFPKNFPVKEWDSGKLYPKITKKLAKQVIQLSKDEDLYKEIVKEGEKNLKAWYGVKEVRKRFFKLCEEI